MSIFLYFLYLLPIFLLSFFIISKKLKPSKWKLPPGPKTLPIIGNLHNLKGLPHACFRNLSQTYGPVMLLRFGFVPVVVISSREGAEEALKTQDLECCSRPETVATRMISYNFKDIGFAPYGEEWKALRKLVVVELLNMKKFQSFSYIREEENNLLVKKLAESARTQSPVNMKKTLFTLVASIVCRLAFGIDIHKCEFVDEDNVADLVHKFELVVDGIAFSDFFPGVGWLIDRVSGQNKTLNNVFSELDTFFQNILDDHLKPGRTVSENPDVVDVMVDLMKKQEKDGDSFKLTTDHFKGIISDIFLAGVNTSVITLIWAMTELIRNPRVMEKVQDEIRTSLGDKKDSLTADDLNHLHYFKLVVKETFRLHPAAPLLLPRETMSQVKIQGYDIPKKSQMMINIYSIARDPKLWTNPDEFNPDRFLDSSVDYRGLNFELLPFGSGRRICPGMNMGIATVELGLLNLLYFFNWGLPEGKTVKDIDLEETGSIIISKKTTLELVPLLRNINN
ncbi:Bifunctional dihydrocamalexate synthase/camalexin synthase [Hirschfeldia incana]|nr:Bifunctional dihydrocamalexate synthase/camalexin synthase [Hirschfeldia incana]